MDRGIVEESAETGESGERWWWYCRGESKRR